MPRSIPGLQRWACAALLPLPLVAGATDYQLSASGRFDITDGSANNVLAPLVGTTFTFSLVATDDPRQALYSQVQSDGTVGWCLCTAPFSASATTTAFAFSAGSPVTVYGSNDRDVTSDPDLPVAPGRYDVFEWDGWLHNTTTGGLFDDGGDYPGVNYNFAIVLAGTPDWFDDGQLPTAPLDLSRIVYGRVSIVEFVDGVQVGAVGVDPLLHLENGELVGPGMSVSIAPVSSVPETPAAVLLLAALGGLPLVRRMARDRR